MTDSKQDQLLSETSPPPASPSNAVEGRPVETALHEDDLAAKGFEVLAATAPNAHEEPTPDASTTPRIPYRWYAYMSTADFWLVILIGQILSLCITATNTFTSFLAELGTSMPAFQTFFNYVFLSLIYVPIAWWFMGADETSSASLASSSSSRDVPASTTTLGSAVRRCVRGAKAWGRVLLGRFGWKYVLLSFLDVEGNYFTVLAYRYTNILSAQLINFWSIVCVVIISFAVLKVRYAWTQVIGILICCGGMGLLIASDHMTGSNGGPGVDLLKGDMFAWLGATLYGVSNVFEEYIVSRRPMYEVLSYLGVWGTVILGVQAAIFDRHTLQEAEWNGKVGGYLTGYTLALTLFYSLVPLMLRMASAAVFDISLLTANFWGVVIGIHVFGYAIHYLYPVAFVLILLGLVTYFIAGSILGDAKKPWLGPNQEKGVAGWGTAKLKAINTARKQALSSV